MSFRIPPLRHPGNPPRTIIGFLGYWFSQILSEYLHCRSIPPVTRNLKKNSNPPRDYSKTPTQSSIFKHSLAYPAPHPLRLGGGEYAWKNSTISKGWILHLKNIDNILAEISSLVKISVFTDILERPSPAKRNSSNRFFWVTSMLPYCMFLSTIARIRKHCTPAEFFFPRRQYSDRLHIKLLPSIWILEAQT